jgi:WD40 repeat protein
MSPPSSGSAVARTAYSIVQYAENPGERDFSLQHLTLTQHPAPGRNPTSEREFHGHTGTINALALASLDSVLISGSDDRTVRVWSLQSGECLGTNTFRATEFVTALYVGPGDALLAGLHTGETHLLSVADGHKKGVLRGHKGSK